MADTDHINSMNNLQLAVNEAVARVFDAMRRRDYATAQQEWAFIAGYVEDEFVTQPMLEAAARNDEPLNEAEIAAIEAEYAEAPAPDPLAALWAAPPALRQGHAWYEDSELERGSYAAASPEGSGIPPPDEDAAEEERRLRRLGPS